ncbi:Small-conductance mechanosensitive channel [Aquimixticola soesokkakensis]|uniref:Small-conductance mechanosensitive channel n=1 Tax=Aquimixticola soesokkakensis TaxID=1519096 RepID=A0A1Y5S7B2_9RHOB|nr:mechanosensitive ion channel family protein [Aquimixticola soesokkakensis]SLN33560.1 Small-conductance mechanosensitive channel [Aquimixticola soesokkakensis]
MIAYRAFFIAMFLLTFGAGIAGAQEGGIDTQTSASQDSAIATRLAGIMEGLGGYADVSLTVTDGVVTLQGETLDSASAAQLDAIAGRINGVVAVRNELIDNTDVAERITPALDRFATRLSQTAASLPLLAVAFLVFFLITWLGSLIARQERLLARLAPNAFIADIYALLVRLVFFALGVAVALDILGATALLGTVLGAAGIIGLAISFAVKDTVENFIASVMLSLRQPFQPNDLVEIEGDTGNVIRLTSRATVLLSADGNQIRIPNATVFKARIVNYSANPQRRFVFDLGLAPDSDLVLARATATKALTAQPFVLATPATAVWIEEVGDSTIVLRCSGWIDQTASDFTRARSEAIRLTLAALTQAGIDMPEPGFRLRGPAPTTAPAQVEHPAAPVAPPASDAPSDSTTVTPDPALDALVAAERDAPDAEDLLRSEAPRE